MSAPLLSTGTRFTYGTIAFSAKVVDVTPPNQSHEALATSHMLTEGFHTWTPAAITEGGDLGLVIQWDPGQVPPWGQVDTITVTYRDGSVQDFIGFMTALAPTANLETIMQATVTFKVADDINVTDGGGGSGSAAS